MKRLIYAAAFNLLIVNVCIAEPTTTAYTSTIKKIDVLPSIFGEVAFPKRCRPSIASNVRHSFKIQIPSNGNALEQINIRVPEGLDASKKIKVHDQFRHNIDTNISIDRVRGSNVVTVKFSEPVAPGTILNIDMNNVRVLGVSNAWLYALSVRLVGYNADIPIGLVRYGIY
ncbi:MAG: DUF2808 domain-containing protein [Rhizonema sp. NSF051]|nr:DUF2808 domain-containing protein [Rhizonema sp. NSF051]